MSLALGLERSSKTASPEEAVVVTLPHRASEPARKATPAQPTQPLPVAAPPGNDHASLARQLQSELKRVGCYDGEISGAWTTSTRLAMLAFTERVNAKLPIDKPDPILLALVQSHPERVCEQADRKPPQAPGAASPAVAAPAPKLISPPTEVVRRAELPRPDARPPAPRPEPSAAADPPRALEAPPRADPAEQPQRTAREPAPVPSVGVYERRVRRLARSAQAQQIAYARSLFRNLKRAVQTTLPLP
jgi:hypothetical protein